MEGMARATSKRGWNSRFCFRGTQSKTAAVPGLATGCTAIPSRGSGCYTDVLFRLLLPLFPRRTSGCDVS